MPVQPRIFLSSTIGDFRDLRLAVKFWLEENGFQVLLSECNDFPVDPGSSTFHNCLNALRSCQYVIVLLGYRRGSFYDETKKVTVTRAEYREAYEMVKDGKSKLLACVRAEVEDDLGKGNLGQFEDPEFTGEFLGELRRDEEVRSGAKTGGPFPTANWVFRFREFRDLAQALRSSLRIGSRLRRKAIEANLVYELKSNLKELLTKTHNGIVIGWPPRNERLQQDIPLTPDDLSKPMTVSVEQAKSLSVFALSQGGPTAARIATSGLDEAINSGEFLEYDFRVDDYTVGKIHASLLDLRRDIARLKTRRAAFDLESVLLELLPKLAGLAPTISISTKHILLLFSLANSIHNVRTRTATLAACLSGMAPEPSPEDLAPDTPFGNEVEPLKAERPTAEDVDHWLNRYFTDQRSRASK